MKNLLKHFAHEDEGQDLIEYTLLLAFVALAAAGMLINAGQSTVGIWTQASTRLSQANSSVQQS